MKKLLLVFLVTSSLSYANNCVELHQKEKVALEMLAHLNKVKENPNHFGFTKVKDWEKAYNDALDYFKTISSKRRACERNLRFK